MKKSLLTLLFSACVATALLAVPASPVPFEIKLPDGTTMVVRLNGDEFHSYYSTVDGIPLRLLDNGAMIVDPTVVNETSTETTTRRKVAARRKIGGNFPLSGSPKSLVVLMGFKDKKFTESKAGFKDMLNKVGYNYNNATGSCRDYFIAASNNILQPQFDVYGPYVAQNNMSYYGDHTATGDHDSHAADLIVEACQAVASEIGNLKEYDTNNDGILDNVFVYFAGHNEAEGGGAGTIWPHQSNLSYRGIICGEVQLASYACTSEFRGQGGSERASIGTFCHEFGHVLGLPDLYDTKGDTYGVGSWSIMNSGNYNNNGRTPPTYSAYERFYLGWLTPVQLKESNMYTLEPIETTNTAYLIADGDHNLIGKNPNPSEFFLLENRQQIGWDEPYLPGTGMLVWHIDYNAAAWNNNEPNSNPDLHRIHLEEANGKGWKERGKDGSSSWTDCYPAGATSLNPTLHDGTILIKQPVFNISQQEKTIYFTYGSANLRADKEGLDFLIHVNDKGEAQDWEAQSVHFTGTSLRPDTLTITTSASSRFRYYVGSKAPKMNDSKWARDATLYIGKDSTVDDTLWVAYMPSKISCDGVSMMMNIKGRHLISMLPMKARAPRQTYVTTPTLTIRDTTGNGFTAVWKVIKDATAYYMTIYKVSAGDSKYVQGFEFFDDPQKVKDAGWESTTNATTPSAKAEGNYALDLRKTGDCVTTETYPSAVSEISFWVNAFVSEADTVGTLDWEGWDGTAWIPLPEKKTAILGSYKKKTITIKFDEKERIYSRFRFTFTDNGGSGVAFDAFTATCSLNVEYVYKNRELTIPQAEGESEMSYTVNVLKPQTEYYVCIQCTDGDKGCEEHLTELSAPISITTSMDTGDKREDALNYNTKTHAITVDEAVEGGLIVIYNESGAIVYNVATTPDQRTYVIPTDIFAPGRIFTAKYISGNKMKRKQRWVKIIYQPSK